MCTPNGASAFSTAEMIAPVAGTQPDCRRPSPQRIEGEGYSASFISILGTSVARDHIVGKVVVIG